MRQDLVEVLKKLAKRSEKGLKLDAIVIETTGLADPAPVAQTFFVDDDVKDFCILDSIITLVDAGISMPSVRPSHACRCLPRMRPSEFRASKAGVVTACVDAPALP